LAERFRSEPLSVRDWLVRGLMAAVLIASILAAYWSYRQLVPIQKESREASALVNRLSTEIGVMEGKYTPADLEVLAGEYHRAQGLLFSGEDALNQWFQNLKAGMIPLALDATADFGRAATTNAAQQALAVVPAKLTLDIKPAGEIGSVRSPYERVLGFLDQVARQEKRVDLIELQVDGGSNSVTRALLVLDLWAGDGPKL